jgi:hypothetical protein
MIGSGTVYPPAISYGQSLASFMRFVVRIGRRASAASNRLVALLRGLDAPERSLSPDLPGRDLNHNFWLKRLRAIVRMLVTPIVTPFMRRLSKFQCGCCWTGIDQGGLVPAEGFEPPTYGLQNRCTTTVLSRLGS